MNMLILDRSFHTTKLPTGVVKLYIARNIVEAIDQLDSDYYHIVVAADCIAGIVLLDNVSAFRVLVGDSNHVDRCISAITDEELNNVAKECSSRLHQQFR